MSSKSSTPNTELRTTTASVTNTDNKASSSKAQAAASTTTAISKGSNVLNQQQQGVVVPSYSTLSVLPDVNQQEQMLALASNMARSQNTTSNSNTSSNNKNDDDHDSNNDNSATSRTSLPPNDPTKGIVAVTADQPRTVLTCVWRCSACSHDCSVMRTENRCICNHRSKQHDMDKGAGRAKCKAPGCKCKDFFFIMAEGAWILRCRCKHKHNEHDPNPPYKCTKANCKECTGFDSPWVCNCNHSWKDHQMVWEQRQLKALPKFDDFGDPAFVKRGLD